MTGPARAAATGRNEHQAPPARRGFFSGCATPQDWSGRCAASARVHPADNPRIFRVPGPDQDAPAQVRALLGSDSVWLPAAGDRNAEVLSSLLAAPTVEAKFRRRHLSGSVGARTRDVPVVEWRLLPFSSLE
jgi:hypothetical protein